MPPITASKVLFIKLGEGGSFEKACIESSNTLRLSYRAVNHDLCISGQWTSVRKYFIDNERSTEGVATSHTNQIRLFYEANEKTLWLTFYANRLWWCFSKPEITLLPDQTKERPVIGKWSDRNISGQLLTSDSISGKLLKTQGFRGTICSVPEKRYALAKLKMGNSWTRLSK